MSGKRFSEITDALDGNARQQASLLASQLLNDAESTATRAAIARAISASKVRRDVEVNLSGFGHVGVLTDALAAYGLQDQIIINTKTNDIAAKTAPTEAMTVHLVRISTSTDNQLLATRLEADTSAHILLVPDPDTTISPELGKYQVLDAAALSGLKFHQWIDDRQLGDDLAMLTLIASKTLAHATIAAITTRLAIANRPVCKMILTDLDNTLWGGIVGEDSAEGLVMGQTEAVDFNRYQHMLKEFTSKGGLLAAVSRNQPEDIARVFAERSDLVLTKDDFLTIDASWEPKSRAITRILEAARIAPEAAVFIDDDPLERRQVAAALPGILVPENGHQPDRALEMLRAAGLFADKTTSEDAARTSSTRVSMQLAKNLQGGDSRIAILKSLGIQIAFESLNETNAQRADQLAARVTQFRTARTPDNWSAAGRHVFLTRLRETGMDHGRIGLVIWRQSGGTAILELLCLSCRALNRDIDSAMISETLRQAKDAGLDFIEARIEILARNTPARDLFQRHGFDAISPSLYRRGLHDIPVPDHISIDAEGTTRP